MSGYLNYVGAEPQVEEPTPVEEPKVEETPKPTAKKAAAPKE